jgi:hypothetical protein
MAGAEAGASTAAEWVDFTAVAAVSTGVDLVDFMAVAAVSTGVDLVDFMAVDFTVASRVCTMVSASGTRVSAIGAGFSSAASA